jgi:uncharacterized protein (TIGR03083 family)
VVDFEEHLAILQREGERLASAAERAGFEAAVPTCPDWSVRDLVRHIGGIHRWAETIVREARPKPFDPFPELEQAWPSDVELLDWFRAGHAALLQTLQAAPHDLDCFTVLRLDAPREFWARRQAHETGMHRADADSASGTVSTFETNQAVDGIEELLFGFLIRPRSQLRSDSPRTVWLHADDADRDWLVRVGSDGPAVEPRAEPGAECRLSGTASNLFLLLWNRVGPEAVNVQGDAGLLDLWRTAVQVRWR